MRKNKVRYSKINTMAELREERMRLAWDMKLAENNLKGQYEDFKEMISPSNIFSTVLSGVSSSSGIVGSIIDGVMFVTSLFGGRKRRKL